MNDDPPSERGHRPSRPRLVDLGGGQWGRVLGLGSVFFLVIATFWIVKPIKRGALLSLYRVHPLRLFGHAFAGAEAEQLAKVLNLLAALVAVAVVTLLVRRFRRVHVVASICGFFCLIFAGLAVQMTHPSAATVWSLYVAGDTYNTVMVAVFWALTNDLTDKDEARRIYGPVGLGGLLGGLAGATVVARGVEALGRPPLLLLCAATMIVLAGLVVIIHRHPDASRADAGAPLPSAKGSSALLEGARLVVGSRYLLGVASIVLLYEMVSNVVDFQLSGAVQLFIEGDRQRDAFFGTLGQITGVLSIAVQLLLTTWMLRRFPLAAALLLLPVMILVGSAGFLVVSSLALAVFMSASDNALNYSIHQSAKEALYVPTTRDEKYKAKAFIDMFVQRAAKAGAIGLNLGLVATIGIGGIRWLSIPCLALLSIWVVVAIRTARTFEQRNGTPEPSVARTELSPGGSR